MKVQITLILLATAFLLGGCRASSNSTSNEATAPAGRMPLSCSGCEYVEDKGSRFVAGRIHNGSKQYQDLVMDVEMKDAAGNIIESMYNLSFARVGPSIKPDGDIDFNQGLTRRASITQVTFQLRKRGRNDVKATPDEALSPPYTLQLHVLPVPPGYTVPSPEP
jgi:hypothetical protein